MLDFWAIALSLLLVIGIIYIKWTYRYFKRIAVPYLEPSFPLGNLQPFWNQKHHNGVHLKNIHDQIQPKNSNYFGYYLFLKHSFVIVNLDLVKHVLTKDFQHFTDRGFFFNERDNPISAHLFNLGGDKWRNLRTKLSPVFTSGKLKAMFQTVVNCGLLLEETMKDVCQNNEPINMKEIVSSFTADTIGSCAFGLECNSLKDLENSDFKKFGKKGFERHPFKTFLVLFSACYPEVSNALHIGLISKEVTKFYSHIVRDTVNYREKNKFSRKDFMQLLIELKNNMLPTEKEDQQNQNTLSMNEIIAQSFVFFLAGFETSSSTMTFALYLLAKHPDIQNKVLTEIDTVLEKHNGQISYDSINEMTYMTQVIEETLRLFPIVPEITRKCVKDYQIPGSSIVIKKDILIFIPIYIIHHNEENYPNPEKFDPERFSKANKEARHHYAHIPFGEGPRICIGMRFGLMQTKVGLTVLLKNYKFAINSRTEEPIKLSSKSFVLESTSGIWFDVEKI